MKTLNDYIRESILDDEEELMGRLGSDVKNSFTIIHPLWLNYNKKLPNIPDDELDYLMNSIFKDLKLDEPEVYKENGYIKLEKGTITQKELISRDK